MYILLQLSENTEQMARLSVYGIYENIESGMTFSIVESYAALRHM